jgi:hypothetical protein
MISSNCILQAIIGELPCNGALDSNGKMDIWDQFPKSDNLLDVLDLKALSRINLG